MNTRPVEDLQTEVGPVSVVGLAGLPERVSVLAVLAPQALLATTESVPLTKPAGTIRLTVAPLLLPEKLQPDGAVQVYEVAPLTAAMLYVYVPPPHKLVVVPLIVPGVAVFDAIESDFAAELPHDEFAVTLTVPVVNVDGKLTETLVVP